MTEEELPTPNWLQELEAKRERRVKAKLGHETGAGAQCLKCADKCPGKIKITLIFKQLRNIKNYVRKCH